ncbi:sensor histidine kinase [Clostridium coskatii]|uniref:histidine kinase n=1 Tax=Clostridium coskatii TaxID=1705578 RepID=A0A170NNG7_9CLOT|nr:HAMP domain-containing sensor histidine kinase [Clostridium coskatii]OAA93294.1 Sensor histidine kinase YycG [Clostridium coskatii]OBR95323.1 sensor histidine kinase YycG [Clostridium coskatii]
MGKLNIIKNITFKRQFMLSIISVIILSIFFTLAGLVLHIQLINKGVILRAGYYSDLVPGIKQYINKNKDKILNKDFKNKLEKVIPTVGIEYEVVDSAGKLSYGYFKKPIASEVPISKEQTTQINGRINPEIIMSIPIIDNKDLKGMVILKYYIRCSAKNPNFNFIARYSDTFVILSPFVYIIVFSIFFGRRFNKKLNVPLKQLMEAAERTRVRDLEFKISYENNNELGKLCKSFEDMRVDLKKSLENQWKMEEERREVVSDVAHDLKTPITIIKGHVEGLLESKKLNEDKLYRYLNLINRNIDRMSNQVQRINLLTKIENETFKLSDSECDLIAYINEKSMDYDVLTQGKKVKFVCNIQDLRSSNDLIKMDTYVLSEILDNLVSNSLRFTKEDGRITLNLKLNSDKVIFSVCDTGCGFSRKDLENVFKKFYEGDESRSKEKGHSGLGLYIVKTLVDKLGGAVEVKNNDEGGAEVKVCIPIKNPNKRA